MTYFDPISVMSQEEADQVCQTPAAYDGAQRPIMESEVERLSGKLLSKLEKNC